MRVSSQQVFRAGVDAILKQQAEVIRTQTQVATGKRFSAPSEDPVAAKLAADLRVALDTTAQAQRNGETAEVRLNVEETTIATVESAMVRVREIALQANNATNGPGERAALKSELDNLFTQLLGLANAKDPNGDYLFAGHRIDAKPFVLSGGQVNYIGDQGERRIELSDGVFVRAGDSGARVFEGILDGDGVIASRAESTNTGTGVISPASAAANWVSDTYTVTFIAPDTYTVSDSGAGVIASASYVAGDDIQFNGVTVSISGAPATGDQFTIRPSERVSVFDVVQSLSAALGGTVNDGAEQAALNNQLNAALGDLAQVEERFSGVRATIGARLNLIDAERVAAQDQALALQTSLSQVEDIDLTEAVSNLNQRLTALDAAQRSLVAVSGLSLFNFLR